MPQQSFSVKPYGRYLHPDDDPNDHMNFNVNTRNQNSQSFSTEDEDVTSIGYSTRASTPQTLDSQNGKLGNYAETKPVLDTSNQMHIPNRPKSPSKKSGRLRSSRYLSTSKNDVNGPDRKPNAPNKNAPVHGRLNGKIRHWSKVKPRVDTSSPYRSARERSNSPLRKSQAFNELKKLTQNWRKKEDFWRDARDCYEEMGQRARKANKECEELLQLTKRKAF